MDSTFFIGDAPKFLNILSLFKGDAEFRMRLNYHDGSMDLEAVLLSGVVAIGVRLIPEGPEGVLVRSKALRARPTPLAVSLETQTVTKTLALLCKRPSAYMSISGDVESIVIRAYDADETCSAQSTICTVVRNDEEDVEFKIFDTELSYQVTHTMAGTRWKDYLPEGEVCIRHEALSSRFVFRLVDVLSTTEMYLPSILPHTDVQITMLPEVAKLLRQSVAVCPREQVTIGMDTDLPVFLHVPIGTGGALRMFLGTKEED
jgi:hypothetical protein